MATLASEHHDFDDHGEEHAGGHGLFKIAAKNLPSDPENWSTGDVGKFVGEVIGPCAQRQTIVDAFALELVDGAALLGLARSDLDLPALRIKRLGHRVKLARGIRWAEERAGHERTLAARLGHGVGAAVGALGAAAAGMGALEAGWGEDGNAADWQLESFAKVRDGCGYVVVAYETIITLGGEFLIPVPPGAHLLSAVPILVGVLNEGLIWYKT